MGKKGEKFTPEQLARRRAQCRQRAIDRYWTLADRSGGPNACWPWKGPQDCRGVRDGQGYGQASLDGEHMGAYKLGYILLVGPVPKGMTLDHTCRNRACVNPKHLEPVSTRINLLRGEGNCAKNARKIHCKHGHEFTPENTYQQVRKGQIVGRGCLTCRRQSQRQGKSPIV